MTASSTDELQAIYVKRIKRWRAYGPALFAAEALQLPTEWNDTLGEGIRSWWWIASQKLVQKRKLSVRSGHGAHKTAFCAISVLWFLIAYHPCKIPCTAPTSHQLEDVLWPEIVKWLRRLRQYEPMLANLLEWTKSRVFVREAPEEGFAVPRTARAENPEALQGFHSDHLLFVIDEAPGVPEPIFEVAQGALMGGDTFFLMIGNPSRNTGFFYASHHRDRAHFACMHIDVEKVEGAPLEEIERMARKYGRDSNFFRVRVKGEFPKAEPDQLIPLYLCEEAQQRWHRLERYGPVVWGLDVAGLGTDRTVLVKRDQVKVLEPHKFWRGLEAMQVAGRVKVEWDDTPAEERPMAIAIDAIGIGSGVASRLSEMGLPIVAVIVSESPANKREYWRLRDELYWKVRDWLVERKSALHPDDEDMVGELTIFKWLPPTSDGLIRIERKDEVRKRLKTESSPDVAEALMVSFCAIPPVIGQVKKAQQPEAFADAAD